METPWPAGAPLFGSGRDALVALVRWGAARHDWRRVLLPGYYCPEVPEALQQLAAEGIEVARWADGDVEAPVLPATGDRVRLGPGDVLVVANQLGLRSCPDPAGLAAAVAATGATLVEDHSHDPGSDWARASRAGWAFASLRKTLPLPDGGVVWSPAGGAVPPEPGARTAGAGDARLAAALDRRETRAGADGAPLPFRALARGGASAEPASGAPISPTSRALLPAMPLAAWRRRRARNLAILAEAAGPIRDGRVLPSPAGGVAFAFTVAFDQPAARDAAFEALGARAVAPAVVWPLDDSMLGVSPAEVALSRRLLSIPCDQRYDDADMRALGRVVREMIGG